MTQPNARQRFYFEIANRFALVLRKVAHPLLCEPDVIEIAAGQLRHAIANLFICQAIVTSAPAVELFRQFTHRSVASARDISQNCFYGPLNPGVVFSLRLRVSPAFQDFDHCLIDLRYTIAMTRRSRPGRRYLMA
jgi:hypothetical protein